MGAHPRQPAGDSGPCELELDELVESLEALVAEDLVFQWAKHVPERQIDVSRLSLRVPPRR
jgi:hypothetical protein